MYGKKKKGMYLKGGQYKLDANNDGKISGADFPLLRKKKKAKKGMKYSHGGRLPQLD